MYYTPCNYKCHYNYRTTACSGLVTKKVRISVISTLNSQLKMDNAKLTGGNEECRSAEVVIVKNYETLSELLSSLIGKRTDQRQINS